MGGPVAAMVIKEKHIVRAFLNARATAPGAAVVPEDIGVHQRLIFGKLRRRAILREAGAGRYYLDELSWEAYRSMRRRIAVVMLLIIAISALVLYMTTAARAQDPFDPEARLKALGLTLPAAAAPVANYVRAVRTGNLVFLAGHGECATPLVGKLGAGVSVDSAYASAQRVGLCLLSSLKNEIGDLRKVRRIVKVLGMVNSAPDFVDQPRVMNGFSDLMVSVFGERGRHARSAVGMGSLPRGMSVEIEMVVEVDPT